MRILIKLLKKSKNDQDNLFHNLMKKLEIKSPDCRLKVKMILN